MFGKPKDYPNKASEILSIEIEPETINSFIEIKASRDLIVHCGGIVNKVYLDKTLRLARSQLGERLPINEEYYISVVSILKKSC